MSSVERANAPSERLLRAGEVPGAALAVAVLIPCHNEEQTVPSVIADFRQALPEACIYVYDNQSTDATYERAVITGEAIVRHEPRLGKGTVVRRMFADIDADVYVMVDGDNTYHAPAARSMVDRLVEDGLDMVVGRRQPFADGAQAYRRGHAKGNVMFTRVFRFLFGGEFTDIFSGYRVMSRRFVKSFPGVSSGFEIETELSTHAATISAGCREHPIQYRSRGENSDSKLRTYRDGARILRISLRLFKDLRPLRFFGALSVVLTAIAISLGAPVFSEYVHSGLVPRFPTAILAAAVQTVAFICLTCGLVLENVARARQEMRRLAYLQIPGPTALHRNH